MALRNLTVPQMIGFTGALLEPGRPARQLLEQNAATRGLLERLAEVHAELVASSKVRPSTELTDSLKTLQATQAAHDDVHDGLARGAFHLLTGLAELSRARGADARTRHFLDLREAVFPNGLDIIQDSYADEASEAMRVGEALTDAQRAALAEVPTLDGRTLLDEVSGRLDAARSLGDLEARRLDLEGAIATKTGVAAPAGVLAARRRWLHAVKAMLGVIRALREPDARFAELVAKPLAALEDAADRALSDPGRARARDAIKRKPRKGT